MIEQKFYTFNTKTCKIIEVEGNFWADGKTIKFYYLEDDEFVKRVADYIYQNPLPMKKLEKILERDKLGIINKQEGLIKYVFKNKEDLLKYVRVILKEKREKLSIKELMIHNDIQLINNFLSRNY